MFRNHVTGKQPKVHKLDGPVLQRGRHSIEDTKLTTSKYWHDSLVILREVFDEIQPKNLFNCGIFNNQG